MNRYFSKLSKRTGIDVNSAGRLRVQTTRVDIRSALQPNPTASTKRGLEVNVEKISDSEVSQHNFEIESSISKDNKFSHQSLAENNVLTSVRSVSPEDSDFSLKNETPSQSLKADSIKNDIDDGSAELRSNIPGMGEAQSDIFEREELQIKNLSEDGDPSHESSGNNSTVKKNGPEHVLLINKNQYIIDPDRQTPNHILPESESREAGEANDDSSLDPIPDTGAKETPVTSSAMIESSEKKPPHWRTRAIHIVSERGRIAETKLEKAETAKHDNSVDIHIGTISFEVYQSPEKKPVIDHPPPVQKPVVIQQASPPKTPRLSRYYLRGM